MDIGETGQRGLERTGNRVSLTQVPYLLIGLHRESWGLVHQSPKALKPQT